MESLAASLPITSHSAETLFLEGMGEPSRFSHGFDPDLILKVLMWSGEPLPTPSSSGLHLPSEGKRGLDRRPRCQPPPAPSRFPCSGRGQRGLKASSLLNWLALRLRTLLHTSLPLSFLKESLWTLFAFVPRLVSARGPLPAPTQEQSLLSLHDALSTFAPRPVASTSVGFGGGAAALPF